MKYWKNITIELPKIDLEEVTDKLMELNIIAVIVKDKRDINNSDWFHNMSEPVKYESDTHTVSLLVEDNIDNDILMRDVTTHLCLNQIPKFKEHKFQDQDWEVYTQNQFSEIIVSKNLRVIPPWAPKTDFKGINIIIEPGSGFGVGSHPTTQLCLQWLESNIYNAESLLDYGSGSGILSIAAKKLGLEQVVGIEIDSRAIVNSNNNCLLNDTNIDFYESDNLVIRKDFDIVIANIYSGIIINLSEQLKSFTKNQITLSGILSNQADMVIDVFSNWIELKIYDEKEEWVILSGKL
ncbi:MAG: 50S ribosomal protein L11 methyltransferase [Candidatus Neomarinimicrobiota bacterium]